MNRADLDRRKAIRDRRISDCLEAWEGCRRREERRQRMDNVRIAHWIGLFEFYRHERMAGRG